jgi:hypothetical protein
MASLRKAAGSPEATAAPAAPEQPPLPPPAPPPAPLTPADETGEALRKQIDALRQSEELQKQYSDAVTRQNQLAIESAKRRNEWLEQTPGAKDHVAELNVLHGAALQAGLADSSPAYFQFLEQQLASLPNQSAHAEHLVKEMQERIPPPPPPRPERGPIVSAPVSRQVPGTPQYSNRITLSMEQKEFAKIAGISEVEYARQLMKLNQMKMDGSYSDRR